MKKNTVCSRPFHFLHAWRNRFVPVCLVLFLWLGIVNAQPGSQDDEPAPSFYFDSLKVEMIGKYFEINRNVTEYQTDYGKTGNTSVRNVTSETLRWKTQGYYQRNRDLGQLFIPKKDTRLKSIVLRTGPARSAVLYNTPGAKVFMQFFEISGTPVINDNGTPKGTESTHGFNTNHRTDDYIEGIDYHTLDTIFVGTFAEDIPVTRDSTGATIGTEGNLVYMRWSFRNPMFFKANKRYGFIVGFLEPGPGYGFTLANANRAAWGNPPSLNDAHTPYKGGWAFRREGDGTLPPTMFPGENPPDSDSIVNELKSESLFDANPERFLLSPTSDGFPDVDTYRAYEFYMEEVSSYIEINGIALEHDSLQLNSGDTLHLTAVFEPGNATNQKVTWFSSDDSTVSVDTSGMIIAQKPGLAAVTVFADEGGFYATTIVKVNGTAVSSEYFSKNDFIQLFPNPNNGDFTIESTSAEIKKVEIYSANGVLMFSEPFNIHRVNLDVELPAGFYFIQVTTEKSEQSKSMIIE